MRASKSATVTDGVFQYLQEGISSGRWKPGDKLPSEAELCRELSASRVTVSRILNRWVRGGTVALQYRSILLRDPAALEELCRG